MLSAEGCTRRCQRLSQRLADHNIDAALLTDRLEIYYFTGTLLDDWFPACLWVGSDGGTWLAARADENVRGVENYLAYGWSIGGTMNPDNQANLGRLVEGRIGAAGIGLRLGWQSEAMRHLLVGTVERVAGKVEWVLIDEILADMQKRKDKDEIEVMRQSIRINLAAYTAVQAAIEPGISELEILAAGQRAAHLAAGEKVFHDGDYRCGAPGGFATDHAIEKGELYVIDAWTIYRGYWADLCRTFVVGGEPTDLQQSIYDHIKAFHQQVPTYLKPGRDGSECFAAMDAHIRQHPALAAAGLIHHAGHNVGMRAHQMPDLNAERGGLLEVGNVVCVEPGAYLPEVCGGVRLENMYLITETGVENLSEYPMELMPQG